MTKRETEKVTINIPKFEGFIYSHFGIANKSEYIWLGNSEVEPIQKVGHFTNSLNFIYTKEYEPKFATLDQRLPMDELKHYLDGRYNVVIVDRDGLKFTFTARCIASYVENASFETVNPVGFYAYKYGEEKNEK